jgi:minor extracellular serine protease Vpr
MSVAAALLALGVGTGVAGGLATDAAPVDSGIDTGSAIVQLKGDPLSTYAKIKPPQGKKIDFSSSTVKSYRAVLSAERNDFKQWLHDNAPNAKVTGQYDISLNAVAVQLNGTPLSTIQSAPLVETAQYEGFYTPQAIDPDLTLINAFSAWGGAGNGANAGVKPDGSRVKVGIIDTGIDVTQPCFNDTGFPNTPKQGPPALTNNKVIVAKVFYNKAANEGLTPLAVQAHGTHVAGTVACDYGTNLGAGHPGSSTTTYPGIGTGSVVIPYGVQGVAPGAQLGNYNVFPDEVTNARSEDILNALESAYSDGMDVVNMSLGGGPGKSPNVAWPGVKDLLSKAVNDLDQAGMISAIAAGNSGPGSQTIGSPGLAGAVTVGHFIGVNVTVSGTDYAASVGQFGPSSAVSGTWMSVSSNGCSALSGLAGEIALIPRGTCTFSTKIRNAQDAGAVGVVIRNNVGGPPISMAQDGTPNQPTIPGVMVANTTGALLATGHDGDSATINATPSYVQDLSTSGVLASFSSRGPTNVDFRVKPDVTAPGVNVLSSIPGTGPESCAPFGPPCWAFFQGTSMATPHLAGSAAVVLGQHPTWPAWAVRSAIVNTADPSVLKTSNGTCCDTNANDVGSGLENLGSAVSASLGLDPVSVSFGAVPSGSSQTKSFDVTIMNLTSGTLAVPAPSISGTTGAGVSFSASGGPFSLAAGGTAKVTVTMAADKGAGLGAHQATLSFGSLAHAVVFVWIKQ